MQGLLTTPRASGQVFSPRTVTLARTNYATGGPSSRYRYANLPLGAVSPWV